MDWKQRKSERGRKIRAEIERRVAKGENRKEVITKLKEYGLDKYLNEK